MADRLVILDGYNLLLREHDAGSASLVDAREAFLRSVDAARSGRERVVVVFDGRPGGGASAPASEGLRVVWSRSPQTADDVIVRLVEKEPRHAATVLTRDRELGHRVKSAGGLVGDPDAFFVRARPPRASGPKAREKPKAPRGEELDRWEQLFEERDGENE